MEKNLFKLYCVAMDGAYQLDSEHEELEQAENTSADMGSKWYFYPFHVIVKGKTIVETGGSLFTGIRTENPTCCLSEKYKGKRFSTFIKDISSLSKREDMANADCEAFELELIN